MKIITKFKDWFISKKISKSEFEGTSIKTNLQSEMIQEKEKTLEELYPEKSLDEIWFTLMEKDDDDLTGEELSFKLGMTLHNEHIYGRSSAIIELVENRYQILQDEYGNPFKELINFTLLYFTNGNFTNKEELLNIIKVHFPIMSTPLIRQLNLINPNLQLHTDYKNDTIIDLDEQKGYDEFLDFAYKLFTQSFTDIELRNNAIRNNFKIFGSDLISFIDTENEKKSNQGKQL